MATDETLVDLRARMNALATMQTEIKAEVAELRSRLMEVRDLARRNASAAYFDGERARWQAMVSVLDDCLGESN